VKARSPQVPIPDQAEQTQSRPAGTRIQRAPRFRVGAPGDAYEREADRAAMAVMAGGKFPPSFSLSRIPVDPVRREGEEKDEKEAKKYEEAAKKIGEAFLETPLGKKLKKEVEDLPAVKGAKNFAGTLHGKVIIGSAATGALAALAATGSELPAQIPEIPLDSLTPGLKLKITYEGPVNRPTKAMISFSYSEQVRKTGGPTQTPAERRRSGNARMAEELNRFRRGLRYPPGSPEALERAANDRAVRSIAFGQPGKLPELGGTESYPGLPPQPARYELRLPGIWKPEPISLIDKSLELKPASQVSGADGPEKRKEDDATPVQRADSTPSGSHAAPDAVGEAVDTTGTPLDPRTRDFMEGRFGHDFSRVRIHADARAARAASAIQARAYTTGHHVVFGAGQFAPETHAGRRLLAHELAHVVQQGSGGTPGTRGGQTEPTEEIQTRRQDTPGGAPSSTRGDGTAAEDELETLDGRRSGTLPATEGLVQRDFAIEPPRPDATGRALSEAEMQEALEYNNRVVAVIGPDGIRRLRDVLAISGTPAVVDEDFINAVVRWQAMQGITQDGKLGPQSSRPLFREIGAEQVGHGEVASGPTYSPSGTISPPVRGGTQRAHFRMRAEFRHDPARQVYASCCEVRQFMRWDPASAAAMPGGIPHAGFPAGFAPNRWIEDRDARDNRYGHRSGPHSDPQNFDQYIDTNGRRNQAYGHLFRGSDTPGGPARLLSGSWRFRLQVVDVSNGNRRIGGTDHIRVNW